MAVQARAAEPTASQPTTRDLLDKIAALQSRLDQVEKKTADQAAAEARARAADADAIVDKVLRDANSRSQFLQQEGFTAGYTSGKFILQSADGRFVLNPNIGFQFRGVANSRDGVKNGGSDDTQSGFEVRRLKLAFDGNMFSPDVTYRFQWNTNRKTGSLELDEGWVRYQFHDTPFAIRAGSMGNTWDHETEVSYKRQLAVERSLLHELITSGGVGGEDYVQGVQFLYEREKDDPIRAFVMLHDGFNSRNTNFQDGGGGGAPVLGLKSVDWAVSGRVEYKVDGNWGDYRQYTALNNKKDLLVVGAGFDYEDADNLNALFHTVDVQWDPQAVQGLSLYAAYVGLYRDFRNVAAGAGVDNTPYDWGFVVQAGYLLNDQWEVFARYDYTDLDARAPAGAGTLGAGARMEDKVHEITVGANYYLYGHNAKFTLDATYLPNGSPFNLDSAGILSQPASKDQFVLRGQFQLLL